MIAGSANVVAGHPFDTVKVVLQAARPGEHAGAVAATRQILRAGGVRCCCCCARLRACVCTAPAHTLSAASARLSFLCAVFLR
jgi:hypothetical protein